MLRYLLQLVAFLLAGLKVRKHQLAGIDGIDGIDGMDEIDAKDWCLIKVV